MDPVPGPETRAVMTAIRGDRLLQYLTGRRALVLPAGARLTAFWRDDLYRHGVLVKSTFRLKIEHKSFALVEPGTRIPKVPVARRRIQTAAGDEHTNGSKALIDRKYHGKIASTVRQ